MFVNFVYKYKIFYWIYDSPLLDNLITFWIPLQTCHFLNKKLTQVLLHCILMVYIFVGNFKSLWKYKYMIYMMSFLIVITMLTNNSWVFCSSFSIFVLSLVKWWLWSNNLNNIYVSPSFLLYWVRLNWQVYCMGSF